MYRQFLKANIKTQKDNGLKIGFYHYVTARTEEEAKGRSEIFLLQKLKEKEIDCRLAMDFERFAELSKNEINKVRFSIYGRII